MSICFVLTCLFLGHLRLTDNCQVSIRVKWSLYYNFVFISIVDVVIVVVYDDVDDDDVDVGHVAYDDVDDDVVVVAGAVVPWRFMK